MLALLWLTPTQMTTICVWLMVAATVVAAMLAYKLLETIFYR